MKWLSPLDFDFHLFGLLYFVLVLLAYFDYFVCLVYLLVLLVSKYYPSLLYVCSFFLSFPSR